MIYNIRILRAFAALLVVLYHIIIYSESKDMLPIVTKSIFKAGDIGVDLFFIISGFIITNSVFYSNKSAAKFMKDRFFRVAPTYYLVTLTVASLLYFFPFLFGEMKFNSLNLLFSLLFFSQFALNTNPVLQVGWSLEFEFIFYILSAISIFLFRPNGVMILPIIFLSVAAIFGYLDLFVLEFVLGIVLFFFYDQNRLLLNKIVAFFFVVAFFIYLFLMGSFSFALNRLLLYGVPSFIFAWSLVSLSDVKSNIFTYIGDSSYSLYLTHVMVIPAFYKLIIFFGLTIPFELTAFICFVLCVAFAIIFYELVEVKLILLFRKF